MIKEKQGEMLVAGNQHDYNHKKEASYGFHQYGGGGGSCIGGSGVAVPITY